MLRRLAIAWAIVLLVVGAMLWWSDAQAPTTLPINTGVPHGGISTTLCRPSQNMASDFCYETPGSSLCRSGQNMASDDCYLTPPAAKTP